VRTPHYTSESLAGFLSGVLDQDAADLCRLHLAECNACLEVLAELAYIVYADVSREEEKVIESALLRTQPKLVLHAKLPCPKSEKPSSRFIPVLSVAAALLIVIAIFQHQPKLPPYVPDGLKYRAFEARVSFEPYAEFRGTRGIESQKERAASETGHSGDPTEDWQLGRYYLWEKRFQEARAHLEWAAERSASAAIYNDLGVVYMQYGDEGSFEKALKSFQRSLLLDPQFAPALFNAGIACELLHLDRAAMHYWKLFLIAEPHSQWSSEIREKLALHSVH